MIYCVEDDDSIRELVTYTLQGSGFETRGFDRAAPFWEAVREQKPELVLLDILLPDDDGISILKQLRAVPATASVPVILLTAKSGEFDRVYGLDCGADDYICKPFGLMELLSRVRALLRRTAPKTPDQVLRAGDIVLDSTRHIVTAGGHEVQLTFKEFELLRYLMAHAGLVFTRDNLLQTIWGYDFDGETRTVDVHIRMLRQKLGVYGGRIETVRGIGYKIAED